MRNVTVSAVAVLMRNFVTTPSTGAVTGKADDLFSAVRMRVQGVACGGDWHCVTFGLPPLLGVSVSGLPNCVAARPEAGSASAPAATAATAKAALRVLGVWEVLCIGVSPEGVGIVMCPHNQLWAPNLRRARNPLRRLESRR